MSRVEWCFVLLAVGAYLCGVGAIWIARGLVARD